MLSGVSSSSSLPSSLTEAYRNVVTAASKSLSLSLSGYSGDVNSCLWLVNVVATALDLDFAVEGAPSAGRILDDFRFRGA